MAEPRIPMQKRSVEKKQKILKAGFNLFCEKGYYKTNTIEIAKSAGVSTGIVYNYFTDKKEIYIVSFEQYLQSMSKLLFEKLEPTLELFVLSTFVDNWINSYIEVYSTAGCALVQLKMMILEDKDINVHFSNTENIYIRKITDILKQNKIQSNSLFEKVYTASILIDALRQEKTSFPHKDLDFNDFRVQVHNAIMGLLTW